MPREIQFDYKERLGRALQLFWRRGYHATSMSDIKAEMELNPGSIYSAFGSKRDLYIKALDLYEESVNFLFERIQKEESAKERILYIFKTILNEVGSKEGCRGCFMLMASLEVAPHDREVQLLADKANQRMTHFFKEEILKGQMSGELSKKIDPQSLSQMLVTLLYGLRVRALSHPSSNEVSLIVDQVEKLLSV